MALAAARQLARARALVLPRAHGPSARGAGLRARRRRRTFAADGAAAAADSLPTHELEADARFARVREWVALSDVHMCARTRSLACASLRAAHEHARARGGGVLLLGDFWHARGAIPVAPLADAVRLFAQWEVPTIILAGNHDMVSLDGRLHSLDALAAAAPPGLVRVIDEPTAALGSVFLPYRRRHSDIVAALQAAARTQSLGERGPTAVFCHADVIGAAVNESHQSALGLAPSAFGAAGGHVRGVYSGHYHKPQAIDADPGGAHPRIEYIGSPYQLTFAEEGQDKRMLLFESIWPEPGAAGDSSGTNGGVEWRRVGELPLDIGPRHFSVEARDALAALDDCAVTDRDGADCATSSEAVLGVVGRATHATALREGRSVHATPRAPREGDRVRMTLESEGSLSVAESDATQEMVDALRAAGVAVDVVRKPETRAERIEGAARMAPTALLRAYAECNSDTKMSLSPNALSEGLALLESLAQEGVGEAERPPTHVRFSSVTVEGFGPFANEVTYPLENRGVRMVTGSNRDGEAGVQAGGLTSSSSNGAGKTSLVMAPLWALSGETDPRPEGSSMRGLSGADVINENCTSARVLLQGAVNGTPFTVERITSRSRGGKKALTFTLGGRDMTTQEMALTQEAIDSALLPADLLSSVAFHGQHTISVGCMIDSTDTEMKRAMMRVVPMDVWEAASEEASSRLKSARESRVATAAESAKLAEFVARLADEADACAARAAAWDAASAEEVAAAQARTNELEVEAQRTCTELLQARLSLHRIMGEAATLCEASDNTCTGAGAEGGAQSASDAHLSSLEADAAHARDIAADAEARATAAVAEQGALAHRLDHAMGGADSVATCDRCLQPVDAAVLTAGRLELEAAVASVAARATALAEEAAALRADADARARALEDARRRELEDLREEATRGAEQAAARDALQSALRRADSMMSTIGRALDHSASTADILHDTTRAGDATLSVDSSALPANMRAYATALDRACASASTSVDSAARAEHARAAAEADARARELTPNPHLSEQARLRALAKSEADALARTEKAELALAEEEAVSKELDVAFGRRGVQSFVLDEALSSLTARSCELLRELSGGGITLALSATTQSKSARGGALQRVGREIRIRSKSGEMVTRSLKQCSGGERRRVALALALAYGELAAESAACRVELLVLDEALAHLDEDGMHAAARLFRRLSYGTVLVVCQANSALEGAFAKVDTVVKEDDRSFVVLDGSP